MTFLLLFVPLRIQQWWSLKPFYDRGVDHFMGTTRDERHFEFLVGYWTGRRWGCGHRGSLLIARMHLRLLQVRIRRRETQDRTNQAFEELIKRLDEAKS